MMALAKEFNKVSSILSTLIDVVKVHGVELNNESLYYITKKFKERVNPCSRKVHYYLTLYSDAGDMLITKIVHGSHSLDVGFKDVYGNSFGNASITHDGEIKNYRI